MNYTDPNWTNIPVLLSTEEAANLLRVHVNTVKKLITDGELPAKKVGRAYRINKIDLQRFVGLVGEAA